MDGWMRVFQRYHAIFQRTTERRIFTQGMMIIMGLGFEFDAVVQYAGPQSTLLQSAAPHDTP